MKMKRILSILYVVLCTLLVCGQDMQRIAERSVTGTARYVGLGGAMTAVGGDPSAVQDNPAGVGVYRRMEVSFSFDVSLNDTWQTQTNTVKNSSSVSASQISWVTTINSSSGSSVVSNSFMIGYQRLRTYNSQYSAGYAGDLYSLMDVAAIKTNGLAESALQNEARWRDSNIGWLSIMGYENYLIDPVGKNQWITPLSSGETVTNQLNVNESGYQNAYSFAWGMNYVHQLYVGAGLNLQSLSLRRRTTYTEYPSGGGSLLNEASVVLSGVGFDVSGGVIYRPCKWVRLGASVHAPSFYRLNVSNSGTMEAMMRPGVSKVDTCETPANRSSMSGFLEPMRLSAGVAVQFANYGLLSLQYDLMHGKQVVDEHALRAGLEVAVANKVLLDVSYVYRSSFRSAPKTTFGEMYYDEYAQSNALVNTSVRTDTDFQRNKYAYYIGAGIGYHGTWGTFHAAYQYAREAMDVYAHEFAAPYDMSARNHRIVFTLNWHTKN